MNNKNTAAEIMPILNKYGLKIIYRPDPIKASILNLEKFITREHTK